MTERSYHKRRGGSLVFPIILIVLGVLLLLDNLNITPGIDWATIWKLWPLILIAIGLEVILGRRVSFGTILLIVIIVVIGGAAVWWSVVVGSGERTTERLTWPKDGIEQAEAELSIGVGKLQLTGQSDIGGLMIADLDLSPGAGVSQNSDDIDLEDDTPRAWIVSKRDSFPFPRIFGGSASEWDLSLNDRVRWNLSINSGVGDVRLDLSDLKVGELELDSGVGSVDLTLPRRGTLRAKVDGGVGDVNITVPEGAQARLRVDRGIGSLNVGSRFKRRGDFYETEGFNSAESFIDLEIDIGVGTVSVR